jgi:hypothetical protein
MRALPFWQRCFASVAPYLEFLVLIDVHYLPLHQRLYWAAQRRQKAPFGKIA